MQTAHKQPQINFRINRKNAPCASTALQKKRKATLQPHKTHFNDFRARFPRQKICAQSAMNARLRNSTPHSGAVRFSKIAIPPQSRERRFKTRVPGAYFPGPRKRPALPRTKRRMLRIRAARNKGGALWERQCARFFLPRKHFRVRRAICRPEV